MGSFFDGFRLPDGAEIVGRHGDEYKMRITVPTDDDGFLGRQCPGCSQERYSELCRSWGLCGVDLVQAGS
jgi:hypothetical protein